MEDVNTPAPAGAPAPTENALPILPPDAKLGAMISFSFKMTMRSFVKLLWLFVLFAVVEFGLMFLVPLILDGGTGVLIGGLVVVGIASILLNFIYALSMIHASSVALKGGVVNAFESLQYAFGRLWGGIVVSLSMFWYVFKWVVVPLAVVLILFVVNNYWLGGAWGSGNMFFWEPASAIAITSPGDVPQSIGSATGGMEESGLRGVANMYTNFALTALGIVTAILAIFFGISRGTKASFSLYAFMQDDLRGNAAVMKSVETVKGRFWKIFWNLLISGFVFGFAIGLPIGIVVGIAEYVDNTALLIGGGILDNIGSGIVVVLMAFFMNTYYKKLKTTVVSVPVAPQPAEGVPPAPTAQV
jgi:hypothetical protein